MKLLTEDKLNKIKKDNKATKEEWPVIKEYLSTGKVYTTDEAKICYENMLNNEKWYQKDFSEALYNVNNALICDKVVSIVFWTIYVIFLVVTAIVSVHFVNLFPILLYTPFMKTFGFPGIAKVTKKSLSFALERKVKKLTLKLKDNLKEELNDLKIETKKENIAIEEMKLDQYYVEINKTLNKIITLKYPGYDNDYNNLNEMALEYLNNGYIWSELNLDVKQRLILELELYNTKVTIEEEKLKTLAERKMQYQTLIGNIVEAENQTSLKRSLEKK